MVRSLGGRRQQDKPAPASLPGRQSKIQAVLFDLDGTLIATRRLYLEAYRRALEGYVGRWLTDQELLSFDSRSERRMLGNCVTDDQLDQCHGLFHQHYRQLHATHFEGLYPGVLELLSELRKRGIKLGIVTGKSRAGWTITSPAAALGRFDVAIVDDDVRAPKPDPQGLQLALAALDVQADAALYVGDSTVDIGAAIAAGVTPVAALWSRTGARRVELVAFALQQGALVAELPDAVLQFL